jgi:pimeloyl-ACP methyl ester carboxylesterase
VKALRWLLLRGLSRESRHWGSFPERLAATLGAHVSALDLPGFGSEHQRRSPASVQGITCDVRARLQDQRGDGPWSVLGISLGGMVALDWCARFPHDFVRCVAINTSARLCPAHARFSPAAMAPLGWALLGDARARERAVLRVSSNSPDSLLDRLAAEQAVWLRERPPSARSLLHQLIAASRFDLPGFLPVPLLLLSSTADRLVSHRCSRAIARALDAPLALHSQAGHDLTLDAPEWVCEQISLWLANGAVPPAA